MGKLKDLLLEQHWLVHTLRDLDGIDNDEEEKLVQLVQDAKLEHDLMVKTLLLMLEPPSKMLEYVNLHNIPFDDKTPDPPAEWAQAIVKETLRKIGYHG